jgi:tripartite-type tricarboxylate transporter receptor subunit TctC
MIGTMKNFRSLAAMIFALTQTLAFAQPYPTKPLRFVTGGGPDAMARILGPKLTEAWGQQVVVDTRTGAGGIIGAEMVARAAPDGYTLLLGSGSSMVIAPQLQKAPSYDPLRDFAPVSIVVMAPFVLVAHPSVPAKSVPEFVAAAKARPGFYNFGSAGTGSTAHLGAEQLKMLAGIDIRHVPYKGALPAAADLAGGQIQVLFNSMATALPHVNAGRITLLATGATARSPLIPNTPTIAETYPGFEVVTWYGIVAPAKTPRALVLKLHGEIARSVASPDLIARFSGLGLDPNPCTPEYMAAYLKSEIEKWGKVIKVAGVKVE